MTPCCKRQFYGAWENFKVSPETKQKIEFMVAARVIHGEAKIAEKIYHDLKGVL